MSELTGILPPQNVQLESSVLGVCLMDRRGLSIVCSNLHADDFYLEKHEILYTHIKEMQLLGKAVDIATVWEHITSKEKSKIQITDLMELTNKVASGAHIEDWCKIILEKSMSRKLIQLANDVVKQAYTGDHASETIITEMHQRIMKINRAGDSYIKTPEEISKAAIDRITTPTDNGIAGITLFGIKELDYMLNGGEPGNLILIAARPSMGKSMLANTAMVHQERMNRKCLFWGLEMTEEENWMMYASDYGDMDYGQIKRGQIQITDARLLNTSERFHNANNITFIGRTGVNVGQIRAKITEHKAMHGLDLVIIDHGRLIRKNMIKGSFNDVEEISLITGTLKQTAKELGIPIILLWQLSRATEQRGGTRKPMMSDLRGSGTLEEDADKIGLIHRDYYYTKPEGNESAATIDLAKVRGGETGVVDLTFRPDRARFEAAGEDGWMNDYPMKENVF